MLLLVFLLLPLKRPPGRVFPQLAIPRGEKCDVKEVFFTSIVTQCSTSLDVRGRCMKKSKKKLTSVSFMYVCVAENAELLVFFYFFLHLPHRQFSFRREVLNHHTPPPIPKLSSITKTRILFVFLPKKVPVFCLYFYKNEPV